MDSKLIAFIGESFDILQYIGKTAVELNRKVLVEDLTRQKVVMSLLPIESSDMTTVDYYGVDFTAHALPLKDVRGNYDYIIAYYGMDFPKNLDIFEEIYIFTDLQRVTIDSIAKLKLSPNQFRMLIVRDCLSTDKYFDYVKIALQHLYVEDNNIYRIPFDVKDLEAMLSIQYDTSFNFNRISNQIVEFIVSFYSVDFPEKDIRKSIRLAKWRR